MQYTDVATVGLRHVENISSRLADMIARGIFKSHPVSLPRLTGKLWLLPGVSIPLSAFKHIPRPTGSKRFEDWSKHFMCEQFLRVNHWVGCTFISMQWKYGGEYKLRDREISLAPTRTTGQCGPRSCWEAAVPTCRFFRVPAEAFFI